MTFCEFGQIVQRCSEPEGSESQIHEGRVQSLRRSPAGTHEAQQSRYRSGRLALQPVQTFQGGVQLQRKLLADWHVVDLLRGWRWRRGLRYGGVVSGRQRGGDWKTWSGYIVIRGGQTRSGRFGTLAITTRRKFRLEDLLDLLLITLWKNSK